jgi:hypothetical protein
LNVALIALMVAPLIITVKFCAIVLAGIYVILNTYIYSWTNGYIITLMLVWNVVMLLTSTICCAVMNSAAEIVSIVSIVGAMRYVVWLQGTVMLVV